MRVCNQLHTHKHIYVCIYEYMQQTFFFLSS